MVARAGSGAVGHMLTDGPNMQLEGEYVRPADFLRSAGIKVDVTADLKCPHRQKETTVTRCGGGLANGLRWQTHCNKYNKCVTRLVGLTCAQCYTSIVSQSKIKRPMGEHTTQLSKRLILRQGLRVGTPTRSHGGRHCQARRPGATWQSDTQNLLSPSRQVGRTGFIRGS